MKLPDLISALERNEYAEVLRGTKYEGARDDIPETVLNRHWRPSDAKVVGDALANAATVTVLREAVRAVTDAARADGRIPAGEDVQ